MFLDGKVLSNLHFLAIVRKSPEIYTNSNSTDADALGRTITPKMDNSLRVYAGKWEKSKANKGNIKG